MLRLFSSRPFHLFIRRTSLLPRYLATETLRITHDVDEDHQRKVFPTAHHQLLEVLVHRSSQLSSNQSVKKKKNRVKSTETLPPVNRLTELSEQLHLSSAVDNELVDDEESLLAPSLDDITWNEDDKTLNDILTSLHSNKVRRIHKYTDEQLSLMHKHHEFNRMLQAYIDVSIHNGHLNKVRRLLDEFLADQERRQSMKHLTWRYVSNINIYNSFFYAYAERANLTALQKLFEKMRHSQIKPNLESYAAVLSCLGHMDLFDPNVARRIILDIEKQVKSGWSICVSRYEISF